MDIGKEDAPYTIEPLESPVPGQDLPAAPEPAPFPVHAPEPDRELVPA